MNRLAPALLALLIGLAACSTTGPGPEASVERAEQLAARGDHEASAREYETLAARASGSRAPTRGPTANGLRLLAVEQWLRGARADEAAATLATVQEPLSSTERFSRDLLQIETALVAGRTDEAWQTIAARAEPSEAAELERHHALRQRVALAAARPLEAIRSERAREQRAADDAVRLAGLRAELLTQLREAVTRGLKLDPRSASRDTLVRGWLEAAPLAARAATLPASANRGLTAAWQRRHPNHPALAALLATSATTLETNRVTARAESSAASPTPTRASPAAREGAHVAALLPLSGPQAALGEELRDGMVASYLMHPTTTELPLRFYDTADRPVDSLIDEAVRQGARFLIGPLRSAEIVTATTAVAVRNGSIPLLALDAAPAAGATIAPTSRIHFFALSPEDEARAAAEQALAEGRRRAIALVPADEGGQRVLAAFRIAFEAGGGRLLVTSTLNGTDFAPAIESALRIDASRARHRRVQSVIEQPLAFQPRRRGDVDLLFIPGSTAHVQALRRQLKFQGAGDLPSFTTAEAWDGRSAVDLEQLVFADMPWMLDETSALRTATREASLTVPTPGRLYAFGHDAWLLQDALRREDLDRVIEGASGTLRIQSDGRIARGLRILELHEGVPRLRTPPAATLER